MKKKMSTGQFIWITLVMAPVLLGLYLAVCFVREVML